MSAFNHWFKTVKADWNNHNEAAKKEEDEIKKRENQYKEQFLKNKESYEKKIEEATGKGYTQTDNLEKEYHIMGVHTADIQRMGPEVYKEERAKRQESTFRCKALQRMVKDINRHGPFSARLIYDGKINYCNMVDNSVVDCKVFFDWSLKNNVKFTKDKFVGKII